MPITVDTTAITREKVVELLTGPPQRSWAACAAIWARVFVRAGPGWKGAPEAAAAMREAFSLAMLRAAGMNDFVPDERLIEKLEAFDAEDDGSDEWQSMIDLMGMVQLAVCGRDLADCLRLALQLYLNMSFHLAGRKYGAALRRPLGLTEVKEPVATDPDWVRTVDFVRSL
jgi:hypothetical protein